MLVNIAGKLFHLQCNDKRVEEVFREYICDVADPNDRIAQLGIFDSFPENQRNEMYSAIYDLIFTVSDILLPEGCIFHGAAIRIGEKAYILTGRSGVGKTTQVKNLLQLYDGNVSVINGDKPALHFTEDEGIMVYPSPWNGKERMKGAEAAKLAGIICLKQGSENTIEKGVKKEIVPFLFRNVFTEAQTQKEIEKVGQFIEKFVMTVPVWTMTNRGDLESSKMLYEKLMREG